MQLGLAARCDKAHVLCHPCHLHLHQTVGSRVMAAQCQLPHQCHHVLADQRAPGMHTMANTTESLEVM